MFVFDKFFKIPPWLAFKMRRTDIPTRKCLTGTVRFGNIAQRICNIASLFTDIIL